MNRKPLPTGSPLETTKTDDGIRFSIKARPASANNEIRGVHDGCLVVAVTAVAEKGRANAAIIKLMAKHLGVAKSRLEIVSGTTASRKTILIPGMTAQQLLERLANA
jgi:uncharacterized protein (TIGR00251 family)